MKEKRYPSPVASEKVLGFVRIGQNLNQYQNGAIYITEEQQKQFDELKEVCR